MLGKTLKSLVLRGVPVRQDGQAVELRLGFVDPTSPAPEVPISMRHGGCRVVEPEPDVWGGRGANPPVDNRLPLRAGRPDSHAGALSHRRPTSPVGGASLTGRPRAKGGFAPAVAAARCRTSGPVLAAPAGKTSTPWPPRIPPAHRRKVLCGMGRSGRPMAYAWAQPATRTPRASD
jgi:hypothetical protein